MIDKIIAKIIIITTSHGTGVADTITKYETKRFIRCGIVMEVCSNDLYSYVMKVVGGLKAWTWFEEMFF